jgi:hypothetical protein
MCGLESCFAITWYDSASTMLGVNGGGLWYDSASTMLGVNGGAFTQRTVTLELGFDSLAAGSCVNATLSSSVRLQVLRLH